MGQLVGGNTSLEFYKQLETINNELDSINSELISQAESISSLNSRIIPEISAGYISTGNPVSFTGDIVVVVCFANENYYGIYGFRKDSITRMVEKGTMIVTTVNGKEYTISNNIDGLSVRYIAFIVTSVP